jgi:hypothetical protein
MAPPLMNLSIYYLVTKTMGCYALGGYKNMVTKREREVTKREREVTKREREVTKREREVTKELSDKVPRIVNPPMVEGVLLRG